jgi:hypothetical protein
VSVLNALSTVSSGTGPGYITVITNPTKIWMGTANPLVGVQVGTTTTNYATNTSMYVPPNMPWQTTNNDVSLINSYWQPLT